MYEIVELDDGQMMIVNQEGTGIDARVIEVMFELHKQNSRFFESWFQLAEDYLVVGPDVAEA